MAAEDRAATRSPAMPANDWEACKELPYFMYEKDSNIEYPVLFCS